MLACCFFSGSGLFSCYRLPVLVLVACGILLSGPEGIGQSSDGTASGDPPSLERIIRKVQPAKNRLSEALVTVDPVEETGDGGGRLYWKHDRFVRRLNYRLGGNGELFVYETVSNRSTTAFTFDLLTSSGRSFTYALSMPYDVASDRGYGLSDYFLLDFTVRRRTNVKYPGYLMALNLFPRRLMTFRDRYRRSYVRRNGTRYVVLKRRVVMVNKFYFTEKLYLNTDTWRFDRVVLEESRKRRVLEVTSFQDVNGVALPERVRVTSPWYPTSLPFTVHFEVRRENLEPGSIREPDWLYDPALPVVSDTGTMKIHRKIRKGNVTADLYNDLMMAALRYRYLLGGPSHFHLDAFEASVEQARETHPDSALLKAFYDGATTGKRLPEESGSGGEDGTGGDKPEKKMYVTSFRSIREDPARPFMNYAAAFRSSINRDFESVRAYIRPVGDRFPFRAAGDRLYRLNQLWSVSRRNRFRGLLESTYVGRPLRNHTGLVSALSGVLRRHPDWTSAVRSVAEEGNAPLLRLALARYHHVKENHEQANKHYLKLDRANPDSPIVRNHVFAFLSSAGFRARPLIERYRQRIPYVWMLVRLAVEQFRDEQGEEGMKTTRRVLDRLQNAHSRVMGTYTAGGSGEDNMTHLAALARQLHERGTADRFRSIFRKLTTIYRGKWTDPELLETLHSIYSGNERALFDLAATYVELGEWKAVSTFYETDRFKSDLLARLEDGSSEILPYSALARGITGEFITEKRRLKRSLPILRSGRTKFTDHWNQPHLVHALGDAYVLTGAYDRARTTYRDLLKTVVRSYNPSFYPHVFGRSPWRDVRNAYIDRPPEFQLSRPVPVKYAWTLRKTGATGDRSVRSLHRLSRPAGNGATTALAFLVAGHRTAARRFTLNRFRYTQKKERVRAILDTLAEMFTEEGQYARASLVYDVAIRGKEIDEQLVKEEYRRIRNRIDRERLIRQLEQQDVRSPPERVRRTVMKHLKTIRRAETKKERMTGVTHILNMAGNPVPVLLEHRDAENDHVRRLVRKMLETIRMRQLYREMFGSYRLEGK